VGAILANVVATEAVIVMAYLVAVGLGHEVDRGVLAVLLVLAVTFPLAFYHHSWSFWLGLDHLIESLPNTPGK
jgi:hypothetical protein